VGSIVRFAPKSGQVQRRNRCLLCASNRHPENRNEGPIATFISHALLRTIGILPTDSSTFRRDPPTILTM
jgi:hypothetical protein